VPGVQGELGRIRIYQV